MHSLLPLLLLASLTSESLLFHMVASAPATDHSFLLFMGLMFPVVVVGSLVGVVLMMWRKRKRQDKQGSDET